MLEQVLYVEHHELFNKINNMDILSVIHFISTREVNDMIDMMPLLLKKSFSYPYPSSICDDINFSKDSLFPFLSKSDNFAINQKKMPRQFLFTFPKTELPHQEDVNSMAVSKFIDLIKTLGGRISHEDYVLDDREKLLNPNPNEESDTEITYKFTARILVLKGYYEEFHDKYKTCFPLFQCIQTSQRRNGYKIIAYYASEIIPNFLFLGDYLNGSEPEQLSALQITHVVDATGHETSRKTCEAAQICYLPVNIWDMEDAPIRDYFEEVLTFIHNAYETFQSHSQDTSKSVLQPRVLVHCRAGWSRSTTFVLAFLMTALHMSLRDALIHTVKQRPMICPNEGFRAQLIVYEQSLFGVQSVTDIHDALRVLRTYGLLWTDQSANVIETDFDRIPIQAFKKKMTATEYDIPIVDSTMQDSAVVIGMKVCKAKKPFLKRGEGKRIAKPVTVVTPLPTVTVTPELPNPSQESSEVL